MQIGGRFSGSRFMTSRFSGGRFGAGNLLLSIPSLRAFWDFTDAAAVWQDTARTQSVTQAGQGIGGVTDKSGRGVHLAQATAPSRFTTSLTNGILGAVADGVADSMSSVIPLDLGGSDAVTVITAFRKASDAGGSGCIVELGNNVTNAFQIYAPRVASEPGAIFGSRGSSAFVQAGPTTGYPAPINLVLTGQGNISGSISRLRINGTQVANLTTTQGTGTYAANTLFVGARGGSSFFANGTFGMIMIFNALLSDSELALGEGIAARALA